MANFKYVTSLQAKRTHYLSTICLGLGLWECSAHYYRLKNIWCSFLQHTVVDHSCWYKEIFQGLSIPWGQHNFPASSSTNHKMSVSIWLLNWHAKKAYEREKVALVIHLLADEKKTFSITAYDDGKMSLKKQKISPAWNLHQSLKASVPMCPHFWHNEYRVCNVRVERLLVWSNL